MTMRIVENLSQRASAVRFVEQMEPPFTLTLVKGKRRTVNQNRLQRLWCNEIAEQLGDRTPEEVRGECKLRFGVPILRAENEDFCEKYDRIIRPFSYETKLELMMEPIDFPTTRLMTTKQKTRYLDAMQMWAARQGLVLTVPDWGLDALGRRVK